MNIFRLILTSTLLCSMALHSAVSQPADASVRLDVSGLRNARGDVGCLLFNAADGYPENHAKAYREMHAPINQGGAVCQFKDVAPGRYAAIVFHDENLNGKLDKNLVGIPQEGYMASNNVRPRFSAPGFQDASVAVSAGAPMTLNVQMGY